MGKFKNSKINFYISLTTLTLTLIAILSVAFLFIIQFESKKAGIDSASKFIDEITVTVTDKTDRWFDSLVQIADTAYEFQSGFPEPNNNGLNYPGLRFIINNLKSNQHFHAIFVGFDSGKFIQVIATRNNKQILKNYDAPSNTAYILRSISLSSDNSTLKEHYTFLDSAQTVLTTRSAKNLTFDPRKRPWFDLAKKNNKTVFAKLYKFDSLNTFGASVVRQMPNGKSVFGVDLRLEQVSDFMADKDFSENGAIFMFNDQGNIIAHSLDTAALEIDHTKNLEKVTDSDHHYMRFMRHAREIGVNRSFNEAQIISFKEIDYVLRIARVGEKYSMNVALVIFAPVSDFTGFITVMQQRTLMLISIVILIFIPIVLYASKRISYSIKQLSFQAEQVQKFNFEEPKPIRSNIKEISTLVNSFSLMRGTIRQKTTALLETQKKLELLVDRGIALSSERDIPELIEMIFLAAKTLTNAEGGMLYLLNDVDEMKVELLHIDKLDVRVSTRNGDNLQIYEDRINTKVNLAFESLQSGKTISAQKKYSDSPLIEMFDTSDIDVDSNLYILVTPLKTRHGEIIGAIQLFAEVDSFDKESIFSINELTEFVEALASQAAIAIDNQNLYNDVNNLLNSMIKLLAGAIDAKSPYTGGHCSRVPIIANMLVEAASDSTDGVLKSFSFDTQDKKDEFNIAAWLHDCGKVTTPEYVVDKATKLETLYDRIHEIRMRFEVLLRDIEIQYYQDLIAGTTSENLLLIRLNQQKQILIDEYAFVAKCNVGGESMSDDDIKRLQEISEREWTRHLDNRIGISEDELNRLANTPSESLPVTEKLLSDKPEHIIQRTGKHPFGENQYNFKMDVPEHLYNRGELYNLSIFKGTLTSEERFKINEHITQTIMMLETLPFPKNMRNVPAYAGAHHETMVGTGYPKKLSKSDMDVPARVLAIADIFEALTASDRPYMAPKKLSQALKIMSFMRNDKHIDPDLFELFLKSGIYKTYAEKYLKSNQIDEIDISLYL